MNNNHRQYHFDDDHISYNNEKAEDKSVARTIISESCKTVSDKLNKKYSSVSYSPPSNIVLVNSSGKILDDDVEDDNFEINYDNEQGDQSSTNVDPTDTIEQNLSTLTIKENNRQEKRINNEYDKDNPTNKRKTIKTASNKER